MPRNYQQLTPSAQFKIQLASSLYSVGFILPGSRRTVGFITRDFHALIFRQHSQTNRRGLYTLFLTSNFRCMRKISSVDVLLSTQNVLSRSGRFGGGHTGWSQLQLASSVSPLWWLCLCYVYSFCFICCCNIILYNMSMTVAAAQCHFWESTIYTILSAWKKKKWFINRLRSSDFQLLVIKWIVWWWQNGRMMAIRQSTNTNRTFRICNGARKQLEVCYYHYH